MPYLVISAGLNLEADRCGDVIELQVGLPDVVGVQTRQPTFEGTGSIPLRRLVKETLRMRPSRLMG